MTDRELWANMILFRRHTLRRNACQDYRLRTGFGGRCCLLLAGATVE
jgi:hypothetical protein